jgi:hypothetical protein
MKYIYITYLSGFYFQCTLPKATHKHPPISITTKEIDNEINLPAFLLTMFGSIPPPFFRSPFLNPDLPLACMTGTRLAGGKGRLHPP